MAIASSCCILAGSRTVSAISPISIRTKHGNTSAIYASSSSMSSFSTSSSPPSSVSSSPEPLPLKAKHIAPPPLEELNKSGVLGFFRSTESSIERIIFDFRFLALLAIGGSLAGSLLCFLNGCVYIVEAYKIYWTSCVKGVHTGKMVLRLVEAIDVYLAGTVMLIFGMGLYGLFISNVPHDSPPSNDRALKGSSLFGMFSLKKLGPFLLSFTEYGWSHTNL